MGVSALPAGGMPFTFLAHQAPVLPLKLLWPRWFDGVALCVGSMAPDFAYVAAGTAWGFVSHSAWGLAWFCVPVAVVVSGLVRWLWPTVVAMLPGRWRGGGARLVGAAPPWWVTVSSALVGAASHVLVDAFTHRTGFGVQRWPVLAEAPVTFRGAAVPMYKLLQIPGSVVLAAVAAVCLRSLVRRSEANVEVPAVSPERRRRFFAVAFAGLGVGLAVAWFTRSMGGIPAFVFRVASLGFVGVVVAAVAASPRCGTLDCRADSR